MIYLSEKAGGKLMPKDPIGRYKCIEWIMFQMGGVGPMFGQWNHFGAYAPQKIPYAIERYANEVKRLSRVLNHRLVESHWLAGDEYSIADIINFPWIRIATEPSSRFDERGYIDLGEYPAPQALARRDRGSAGGTARPQGAGRGPGADGDHQRRARGLFRQDPVPGTMI